MERWQGRVAIVTGASSGIGEGIARLLVENGMRVIGVARRLDRLKVLEEELKGSKGQFYGIQCDIAKEEDIKSTVKWARQKLGGTDVLVNNAGVFYCTPLTDIDTSKLRTLLDVNIFGLCIFTREVFKDMRERGVDDGHIFHINSVAGHRVIEVPGAHVYSASKHAVTVLAEGLRRELRDLKTKIRITEISPGQTRSEVLIAGGMATPEQAAANYLHSPCLEPRDVADALVYALSTAPHVQVHELLIQPVGQPR